MKSPKPRAELTPERLNMPEPVDFDYSGDISDEELEAMAKAQPENIDKGGIVISGEPW